MGVPTVEARGRERLEEGGPSQRERSPQRTNGMTRTYRSPDWDNYRMDYHDPHRQIESMGKEMAVVDQALEVLCEEGIIPHMRYDRNKLLQHRKAVAALFEIPWTAISHRMQRLLYAVNAIVQPKRMLAAGVFCGNTFISNAGAAVGPGASYDAEDLVGIEIRPDEAERAERNVRRIDPTGVAHVVAGDAVDVVGKYQHPVELLYLDADGDEKRGKGVYLDILEAGYDQMTEGAVVMAHNSVNGGARLSRYLDHVRSSGRFRASVNVIFDIEGLEVSVK